MSRPRAPVHWALRFIRRACRVIERISPALAARLVGPAMFRTRRRRIPPRERRAFGPATPFVVSGGFGTVKGARFGQAGPVVLLVHGWNGDGIQLGAFAEPLVAAGFQVVAFDAPGHGASSGGHSSLVAFADAFDAVVAASTGEAPLRGVVAHSFGGASVAFALARRNETVAHAGEPKPSNESPRLVFIATPIDIHEFAGAFAALLGLGEATRRHLDAFVEARLGRPLTDFDALRIAARMRAPLLVIHDEQDRAVPVGAGRKLAGAWPEATLRVTQGLGHGRILRHPDIVRDTVAFITAAIRPAVDDPSGGTHTPVLSGFGLEEVPT
jgi:pimeloyl-ACP methyl ester carboxylesterase